MGCKHDLYTFPNNFLLFHAWKGKSTIRQTVPNWWSWIYQRSCKYPIITMFCQIRSIYPISCIFVQKGKLVWHVKKILPHTACPSITGLLFTTEIIDIFLNAKKFQSTQDLAFIQYYLADREKKSTSLFIELSKLLHLPYKHNENV